MRPNVFSLRVLLCIIFLDQTYLTLSFPLATLIFFDTQSRLFPPETTYAMRSAWFGICVALPNIINLFFAPLLSFISDEIGRKKILLLEVFSACLFTFTVGMGIYLGSLILVLTGFVIKGAFCRANPTALAIIGDTVAPHEKIIYMGYLQFAIALGAFTGPFLGGYLAMRYAFPTLNFALPFFIGALIALANAYFVLTKMPETHALHKKSSNKKRFLDLKTMLTQPEILRISLLLLLIQASWSTYYQFMPPTLKTLYQFDATSLGQFIAMIAFWLALTTGLAIRYLHRFFSLRGMLLIATALVLTGMLATALISLTQGPAWLIWLLAFPVAAGDVIAYTCLTAMYSNLMPAEHQGKVMGVGFIIVTSTWSTTALVGGFLLRIHPLLPLLIGPLFVLGAFLLVFAPFGKNLLLSAAKPQSLTP